MSRIWAKGMGLEPIEKGPIEKNHLVAYAEASLDHNPIHLDELFAKEAGFPGVIAHGMLSMAFMADHLRKNFPENEYTLKQYRTRFRKVTFPGDTLKCGGEVKDIAEDGSITVHLWLTNQRQETPTDGEAILLRKAHAD